MVRYPREGGIVSRHANMIYDDMTGGEMFAQIFGFAPSEYIRQQKILSVSKVSTKILTRSGPT